MTTPTPPTPPAGGPKVLGMNRTTLIIVGVAAAAGVAWYLYKSRGSSGSSGTANPNQQTGTTGDCTDANGNPTPCEDMAGVDYSGQLSVIQTELESVLAGQGTGATTTTSSTGTGTGTTTTTPTQVNQYPAISFTVRKSVAGAAVVSFKALSSPTPVPSSYTVAAWQLNGKLASQQTVNAPDDPGGTGQLTINGLHAGWCYNVRVWANGGKVAPPGATQKVCV